MQQYDQRRLQLFGASSAVIMAANLGRYLIFDGLYLWDARLRWQVLACCTGGTADDAQPRDPSNLSAGWMLPWGAQCPGPMC